MACNPALFILAALARGGSQDSLQADTVALGNFVDGIVAAHLGGTPAAVVVVVQGERVLYARGYGYADLAKRTPVDPATSLFHIGSIGKLFTWTAVMQLVEQGKLDLDADVNTYLGDFRIPATFAEPITLRHLMTHTAGFEEGLLGFFVTEDSTRISTIEDLVTRHVPSRVRPPGRLASYSNYGAALAGYIVQRVSGVPFAEYIERYVYQPLGIRYATFREPLPPALAPYGVTGYLWENGGWAAKPYEINGGWVPAGGTSASALDMGRFMVAHLQDGRYGDNQLLRPETAAFMHRRAFSHDPRLSGVALGFYEGRINGHRLLEHGGDSFWFHSDLFLVPEARVGVFVAFVGGGDLPIRERLKSAFMDRYFPPRDSVTALVPLALPIDQYAGSYRFVRMNYTDIDKVVWLSQPAIEVAAAGDAELVISGGLLARPIRVAPIGPHLFRQIGGPAVVGFRADSSGRVSHVFFDDNPTTAAERMPWNEVPSLWFLLLGSAGIIFLTAFVGFRPSGLRTMAGEPRAAAVTAVATAAAFYLTIVVMILVIAVHQQSLLGEIPFAFKAMLALPVGFTLLAMVLAVMTVRAWRGRFWSPARRIHLTLVALAAVAVSWFFFQWNIIGWQLG